VLQPVRGALDAASRVGSEVCGLGRDRRSDDALLHLARGEACARWETGHITAAARQSPA